MSIPLKSSQAWTPKQPTWANWNLTKDLWASRCEKKHLQVQQLFLQKQRMSKKWWDPCQLSSNEAHRPHRPLAWGSIHSHDALSLSLYAIETRKSEEVVSNSKSIWSYFQSGSLGHLDPWVLTQQRHGRKLGLGSIGLGGAMHGTRLGNVSVVGFRWPAGGLPSYPRNPLWKEFGLRGHWLPINHCLKSLNSSPWMIIIWGVVLPFVVIEQVALGPCL